MTRWRTPRLAKLAVLRRPSLLVVVQLDCGWGSGCDLNDRPLGVGVQIAAVRSQRFRAPAGLEVSVPPSRAATAPPV